MVHLVVRNVQHCAIICCHLWSQHVAILIPRFLLRLISVPLTAVVVTRLTFFHAAGYGELVESEIQIVYVLFLHRRCSTLFCIQISTTATGTFGFPNSCSLDCAMNFGSLYTSCLSRGAVSPATLSFQNLCAGIFIRNNRAH